MEIKTGQGEIQDFLTDESHMFNAASDSVEAVYFPESEVNLAAIIKEANGSQKHITISGAGTGITGSRVPMRGGIVVSMEKMLKPFSGTTVRSRGSGFRTATTWRSKMRRSWTPSKRATKRRRQGWWKFTRQTTKARDYTLRFRG